MDIERLIGSASVRLACALLAAVCVATRGVQPIVAVGTGLLAAVALTLSFRWLYDRWMRVAARLQAVVTTLLFGACYLLVVPFFAAFVRITDPLKLRLREGESSWVPEGRDATDARSYQRMG